ncbi:Serine/threonine phosphatase-like protein [Zostera marina]|uniref:Serine/threonine phosphatase-like protein n=1 Tax=Zostera marina TaxID=29655 RepID=A0A0K9NM41_ZOSMR|nr:Serine/threonine phosphatase-like protein [Zostera marina]
MQSVSRLTLFLCCAWVASLLYGEMFAYWVPLWSCSWPRRHSPAMDADPSQTNHVDIAVLTDPQIMDTTSLKYLPVPFVFEMAKFYTDLYMGRSFDASIMPFNPDMILFLGDHFDGGPQLSDEEWYHSLDRFSRIFDPRKKEKHADIQVKYLSGNHDIGYSSLHPFSQKVISRYEKGFGPRNYRFNIQTVEFIVVDAQTLDGPIEENLTSMTWEFIKNVSKESKSNPKVLLSHIPLYRPDGTSCGPHRFSPIINQRIHYSGIGHGVSYQNYLTEETTKRLLELIQPVLILSGHDHDQCIVTHTTPHGPAKEQTLGTVNWQQGNLYPSFMLLSVVSPALSNLTNQEAKVTTHLCFLPMQTHIYIWYLILFVTTFLLSTFWPTNGFGCWDHCKHLFHYISEMIITNYTTSKEKNEDENIEYEMVWDAEGSMHLVKKAIPIFPDVMSGDVGLTGTRGTVMARPQARKHTAQVADHLSVALDMSADAKADDISKSSSRAGKSIARRLIQRLIRVVYMLTIIATVNIPLYTMLLFKDWIER